MNFDDVKWWHVPLMLLALPFAIILKPILNGPMWLKILMCLIVVAVVLTATVWFTLKWLT